MKRVFVFLLSLLALASVFASKGAYTYDSLYSAMMQNNTKLNQAEQNVYNSQLLVKDAKSLYQPYIGYSMLGVYMANPPIGSMSIDSLPLAGVLAKTAGWTMSSYNNISIPLYDGMDNSYYNASVSLSQPLITWGKIPLAVKLAKTSSAVTELNKSDLQRQLEAELNIRLYTLYYINQIYSLIDKAQKDSDELVSFAEEAEKNGIMNEQDVLDAKIQAQEIAVQRSELDSQYSDVIQGLRTLVGISTLEMSDIDFVPDSSVLRKYEGSNVNSLKALATSASSYQLQMVNKLKSAAKLEEDLAWRSIYGVPDVMLNVSAGYGGSSFPLFQSGWRDDDDWGVNVAVVISGNIWDGGRRLNNIDRAKSNQTSADISYESAVDALETSVESNHSSMSFALTKYDYLTLKSENENLKLDKINVENANGQKSKKDVLNQELVIIKNDVEILKEEITLVGNVFMLDYLTNN